jgi:hypothetical protein
MMSILRKFSWRYRYVLVLILLLSVLSLHQLAAPSSILNLNPLRHLSSGQGSLSNSGYWGAIEPTELAHSLEVAPPASPALLSIHDYDFNGPYVGWPLARVCNETTFTPGLVYVCDNNSGGIGNIRNFILTCVRYAIDSGATGLILPRIQRRSEADLSNIFTTSLQPFDYFFDEEHFRYAMSTYCPYMTIFDRIEEVPNHLQKKELTEFYPKELNRDTDGCDGRGVNRHLDHFRPNFDAWLNRTVGHMPSAKFPVTVRFKWATFFEWPIFRDGPEFAATFGDILRIRKDVQELAALTLEKLSKFIGVKPDPKREAYNAPFLGAHLRTESDALGFWPNFDQQSDGYIEQATLRKLNHAYLACGNATDGRRFAEKAWEKANVNVTSKLDLLEGQDLRRLTSLSWDQQALVDFLVLQKSTHFTGCSFSSFTMNIAFKRHLMTGGLMTRQWKSPGDDFSTMVGRFESWYGDWVFMYECMWP